MRRSVRRKMNEAAANLAKKEEIFWIFSKTLDKWEGVSYNIITIKKGANKNIGSRRKDRLNDGERLQGI